MYVTICEMYVIIRFRKTGFSSIFGLFFWHLPNQNQSLFVWLPNMGENIKLGGWLSSPSHGVAVGASVSTGSAYWFSNSASCS